MNFSIDSNKIRSFCEKNNISKLMLFGSALRDDFTPESDIDLLVELKEGTRTGMISLAGMEIELTEMLGQRVELHTPRGLNPRFRERVLTEARVQYEQA